MNVVQRYKRRVMRSSRTKAALRDLAKQSGSDVRIRSVYVDDSGSATVTIVVPPSEVDDLIRR